MVLDLVLRLHTESWLLIVQNLIQLTNDGKRWLLDGGYERPLSDFESAGDLADSNLSSWTDTSIPGF